MKSYNHLWEQYATEENLHLAVANAAKGKKSKNQVARFLKEYKNKIPEIMDYMVNFRASEHTAKEIYDGVQRKKRIIIVPTFKEQVAHHMVMNILKPIFLKGMYEHSYASIPGRGSSTGKKFIKKWIAKDRKNVKYCMKLDVKKFFDSVDLIILKQRLAQIIHDIKFLKIIFATIDSVPRGLPLGFYTSQWLANWYLTPLDHYIKDKLQIKYYMRYMDDMVLFGANKRKLQKALAEIKKFLKERLNLQLKSNYQIFRFSNEGKGRFLDYMGFRFYDNRVTLRRSIMLKATRKARRMNQKERLTIYDARQMLSYLGWLKATNTYNMYLQRIRPYINFKKLRKKVSKHDRRQKTCGESHRTETQRLNRPK